MMKHIIIVTVASRHCFPELKNNGPKCHIDYPERVREEITYSKSEQRGSSRSAYRGVRLGLKGILA